MLPQHGPEPGLDLPCLSGGEIVPQKGLQLLGGLTGDQTDHQAAQHSAQNKGTSQGGQGAQLAQSGPQMYTVASVHGCHLMSSL